MTVRTLMAATALLYLGPLLAGIAGFGWPLVYAFAAIFILWLIVMRPRDWPRTPAAWTRPEVPTRALGQVLVQLLLVAVLFGIGRGIGGVTGFEPALPVALPLAISFLSVPLSRLVWNPAKAAQMDDFLTDAIAQIERASAPGATLGATTTAFLAELDALPEDTPVETLKPLIWRAIEELDPCALKDQLMARAAAAPRRVDLLALILHATEGTAARACSGDYPTACLNLLPDDPALIALYADELARELPDAPDLWGDCPSVDHLEQRLLPLLGTGAEEPLRRLIAETRALAGD